MNLRNQILKEHTAVNRDLIVAWVGTSQSRIQELISLFLHDKEMRVCQRASWPLLHLALKNKELVSPYFEELIDNLPNAKHDAVIRNTLRILQDEAIPESKEGFLYETCFNYLTDMNSAVAIKAFSLTILSNTVLKYPELKEELVAEIEYQFPHGSGGFQSRAKKALKTLAKIDTI